MLNMTLKNQQTQSNYVPINFNNIKCISAPGFCFFLKTITLKLLNPSPGNFQIHLITPPVAPPSLFENKKLTFCTWHRIYVYVGPCDFHNGALILISLHQSLLKYRLCRWQLDRSNRFNTWCVINSFRRVFKPPFMRMWRTDFFFFFFSWKSHCTLINPIDLPFKKKINQSIIFFKLTNQVGCDYGSNVGFSWSLFLSVFKNIKQFIIEGTNNNKINCTPPKCWQ